MKDLSIRQPTSAEIRPVSLLSAAAFYETYADRNTDSDMLHYTRTHFSEERIREEFLDPAVFYLVAEEKEIMYGYSVIRMHKTNPPEAELLRLYVLKDFQRKGIGHILLERSVQLSKKNGAEKIFLAVWQENKNAVNFYSANGFEIKGVTKFDWGTGKMDDDFIMVKDLLKK